MSAAPPPLEWHPYYRDAPMPWADPVHDPLGDIRAHLRAIAERPMAPPGQPTLVPKWLADEMDGTGANVLVYPAEVPYT